MPGLGALHFQELRLTSSTQSVSCYSASHVCVECMIRNVGGSALSAALGGTIVEEIEPWQLVAPEEVLLGR